MISQLRQKLEKGFYVDNLFQMASMCKTVAMDTISPLPFFVMQQVFLGIANEWDERPLPVDEAESVESRLKSPLTNLVVALEKGSSTGEVCHLLDEVVSVYLGCFK